MTRTTARGELQRRRIEGTGWRRRVVLLCAVGLAAAVAALAFDVVLHRLAGGGLAFGVHPQVNAALERSLEDQKRLAALDAPRAALYRERFTALHALVGNLRILALNRAALVKRYEWILIATVGAIVIALGAGTALRQARQGRRLERLEHALEALASGRDDVEIADRGRDLVGTIARMVEAVSRRVVRDRRRLSSLEHLAAWQEAARRQAHELRTPLTAARLELERLREASAAGADDVRRAAASLEQEVQRIATYTERFAAFARLPPPRLQNHDLGAVVTEFASAFSAAWPNLELRALAAGPVPARFDAEQLRQVLVNLCENSALAVAEAGRNRGRVELVAGALERWVTLDVRDDGPGVPDTLAGRLFEPYATSRPSGRGAGLGLAIARKVLLDHGGDLELAASGTSGATFRLLLPADGDEESVA